MSLKETVALFRDCGCEKGCQHKIVYINQEFIIHKDDLNAFLKRYRQQ